VKGTHCLLRVQNHLLISPIIACTLSVSSLIHFEQIAGARNNEVSLMADLLEKYIVSS